jgi:hypothetical protein
LDHAIESNEALKRAIDKNPRLPEKLLEDRLYNLALMWFEQIPPHLYDDYFRTLMAASLGFYQTHRSEIPLDHSQKTSKHVLTETESQSKNESVKPILPKLLARLERATSEPGKKSELAKFLGAPLASVSRWLSEDREPGGEITLKMLQWVEQQERK